MGFKSRQEPSVMEQVDPLVDLIGSILLLQSRPTRGIDLIEGDIITNRRGLYKPFSRWPFVLRDKRLLKPGAESQATEKVPAVAHIVWKNQCAFRGTLIPRFQCSGNCRGSYGSADNNYIWNMSSCILCILFFT